MKRTLCTLLILSLLLSMSVPALATEGEADTPTTHTVGTLDELQTALTNAADNDTIAITATITVPNITLSTDKALTFTRADSDFEGALLKLQTGATLDGFSFVECGNYAGTITVSADDASSVLIQNCTFSRPEGTEFSYGKYIVAGTGHATDEVTISGCQFSGAVYYSISASGNVTISNCNISNSGGVYNFHTMSVSNTTITGNTSRDGAGGITNHKTLTLSNCEIYGNSGVYGADIYSYGTLSITDEKIEGGAFYNEDTNEKVELPLTNYTETIKLKYVADTKPEPTPTPTPTPEPEPTPTTHTVSTLGELQTVLTYAVDDDTIVIAALIEVADTAVTTDKALTITRADSYPEGELFKLYGGGTLGGFSIVESGNNANTIGVTASEAAPALIQGCTFSRADGAGSSYIIISGGDVNEVKIENCTFSGAVSRSIDARATAKVSIVGCTVSNGGGIENSGGNMTISDSKITGNTAMSGGGVLNSGTLTISNCEIKNNTATNAGFGSDIFSYGTMSMSGGSTEGEGYYNEDTGEKIVFPLADYTSALKLVYLTDEAAAERFAPPAENTPSEIPPVEDEPEPTPTPQPTPEPDNDDSDYTPPVYRPSRPSVTVEPDPAPTPAAPTLVCGDAKIDLSRSVVLQGYGDGQLHLEDGLTRAQMATIIYRLLDEDTLAKYGTTRSTFEDVPADMWCCSYVSTIANAGIVNGVGNDRFNPNGKLTWAHIITVMTRFVEPQTYQLQKPTTNIFGGDFLEIEKIAGLTTKQSAFLMEYARTDNLSHACRVAGVNRSTGYKYLKNEDFQYALEQMKTKIVNAAWTQLSSNLETAVGKVVDILNDPKTSTNAKLRATELIFSYAARYADSRDILARMERLEDSIDAE